MNPAEIKDTRANKEEVAVPEGVERMETRKAYVPNVDIVDDGNETLLLADMPGVDETCIDITLEKNVLTIKGKPMADNLQGMALVYSEYGVGDFERSFTLSEEADRDGITASVKDGVLSVKIPKVSPATKKITVTTV